jgi:hypothetical protein
MKTSFYAFPIALIALAACGGKDTQHSATDSLAVDSAQYKTEAARPVAASTDVLDSLLKYDSEQELIAAFGDQVKHSMGNYPEGMGTYPNTLLYPDTPDEVEFVWDDTVAFKTLSTINISGEKRTRWKTAEGVTLGTTMKELEKLNGKSFSFSGFGWDYGGSVSWDDGELSKRNIYVTLNLPPVEPMPAEYDNLMGDTNFETKSPLAQRANPIVYSLSMNRLDKGE